MGLEIVERIVHLVSELSKENVDEVKPKLVSAVEELKRLFAEAKEELEKSGVAFGCDEEIRKKIDQILDQNKKIARGILVLADMLEEKRTSGTTIPSTPPVSAKTEKLPVRIPPPFEPEQRKSSYLGKIEEAFKK